MANKVKFNLKNVHYAKVTLNDEGVPSFGTVKPIPGAVSLAMDPEGGSTKFHADGIIYYQSHNNNGYSGDLEIALVPKDFKKDILGEVEDANGVMIEVADSEKSEFALLFEFDGDERSRRHVLYRCSAARPAVSSKTNEESIDPSTETLSITASPIPASKVVKASTDESTTTNTYNNWFNTVYPPAGSASSVRISGDSSVVKNSTKTLVATTTPAGGTVNWTSNNTSVATVNSSGVVSGVAVGKATIMATLSTDGSVYDCKTITVTNS